MIGETVKARAERAIRALAGRAVVGAVVLVGACLVPAQASGQEIAGVALDPAGEPLSDMSVILHRVGNSGGAMAGTDTTGANGEFRFPLPAQDSAVYFAALRYEGQIYIGPAIQAGGDPVTGYVLQVGPGSSVEAVGAAVGNPRTPPPSAAQPQRRTAANNSDAGALLLVALLALAAAAVFVFTAPRYRAYRTREAVIEVADLENRLAGASGDELSGDERARMETRRDRLKEQLAPRG